jgi:hypothetical protein
MPWGRAGLADLSLAGQTGSAGDKLARQKPVWIGGRGGCGGDTKEIMIDATHLKAYRTAASLLKKGLFPGMSGATKTD